MARGLNSATYCDRGARSPKDTGVLTSESASSFWTPMKTRPPATTVPASDATHELEISLPWYTLGSVAKMLDCPAESSSVYPKPDRSFGAKNCPASKPSFFSPALCAAGPRGPGQRRPGRVRGVGEPLIRSRCRAISGSRKTGRGKIWA